MVLINAALIEKKGTGAVLDEVWRFLTEACGGKVSLMRQAASYHWPELIAPDLWVKKLLPPELPSCAQNMTPAHLRMLQQSA